MKKITVFVLAVVMVFTVVCFPATAQETETVITTRPIDTTTTTVITLEDVAAGVATLEDYQAQQSQTQLAGQASVASATSQTIADGTYYINNVYLGKYIDGSMSTEPQLSSGTIYNLCDGIEWEIKYTSNGYVIQLAADTTLYLSVATSGTAYLEIEEVSAGATIPTQCYWNITTASGGGCHIENVYRSGLYLACDSNGTLYLSDALGTAGTAYHASRRWRIGEKSYIIERELLNSFSISDLYLTYGTSNKPTINKSPSNAIWATAGDFTYTGYDTSYLSCDSYTGTFTLTTDVTGWQKVSYVTAVHKTTNRSKTFAIIVNNASAVLVGIPDTTVGKTHDHSSALNTVSSYIVACKYATPSIYTSPISSSSTLLGYLDNNSNEIYVSRSHGDVDKNFLGVQVGTKLLLSDAAENTSVYFSSNDISSSTDLSNLKIALFVACYTGAGGEGGKNLPSVAVARGAGVAIGFEDTIGCSSANTWTIKFFQKLYSENSKTGMYYTVEEAAEDAGYYVNDSVLQSPVICGDETIRLR